MIICDEIIDAVLSDALNTHVTSYDKATKTVQTENISTKTLYFAYLFINYHSIIDSC